MHEKHKDPFIEQLTELTGQDPAECYQCGKCSAGCPVREFAEDAPNRVVRYVQLGFYDKALTSNTIWMCAGCHTCSSRCPQEYDLAGFMDAMRQIAINAGIEPAEKNTAAFHQAFLKQIENHGRAYEFGMVRDYKLKTFDLMKDVDLAPGMYFKGKLNLLPNDVKDKKKIRKIFREN